MDFESGWLLFSRAVVMVWVDSSTSVSHRSGMMMVEVCVSLVQRTLTDCVCVYRQTGRAAEEDHCRLVADSLVVCVWCKCDISRAGLNFFSNCLSCCGGFSVHY